MVDFLTSDGFLILMGSLFGGLGLKLLEVWLSKQAKERVNRNEFDNTIDKMQNRLDKLEDEVDDWRKKYYEGQDEIMSLKHHLYRAGLIPSTDGKGWVKPPPAD